MDFSVQNFDMFRKEMEKLGKKLRTIERECAEYKEKFAASNEQVNITHNQKRTRNNFKLWSGQENERHQHGAR